MRVLPQKPLESGDLTWELMVLVSVYHIQLDELNFMTASLIFPCGVTFSVNCMTSLPIIGAIPWSFNVKNPTKFCVFLLFFVELQILPAWANFFFFFLFTTHLFLITTHFVFGWEVGGVSFNTAPGTCSFVTCKKKKKVTVVQLLSDWVSLQLCKQAKQINKNTSEIS